MKLALGGAAAALSPLRCHGTNTHHSVHRSLFYREDIFKRLFFSFQFVAYRVRAAPLTAANARSLPSTRNILDKHSATSTDRYLTLIIELIANR